MILHVDPRGRGQRSPKSPGGRSRALSALPPVPVLWGAQAAGAHPPGGPPIFAEAKQSRLPTSRAIPACAPRSVRLAVPPGRAPGAAAEPRPGHVLPANQEPPCFHPPSGLHLAPKDQVVSLLSITPFPPITPTPASLQSSHSCHLPSIGTGYACAREPRAESSAASAGPGPPGGLPGPPSFPHGPSRLYAVTGKQRTSKLF